MPIIVKGKTAAPVRGIAVLFRYAALSELVKVGEIEKVKRGVYRLPDPSLIDEAEDTPLIIIFY